MNDPATGMTEDETKQALDHDAAMKAVAKNKADAVAAGQAVLPDPRLAPLIARAQALRIELGGYASLSPEIRANENVQKTINPKISEYVGIRLTLAVEMTARELSAELAIDPQWFAGLSPKVSDPKLVPEVAQAHAVTEMRTEAQRLTDLEDQMAMVKERLDDHETILETVARPTT